MAFAVAMKVSRRDSTELKERSILEIRRGERGPGVGAQGREEAVVIPGHGGVIKERGGGRVACVFNGDVFGCASEVFCI